jgi:isoleucyl-tRNA synthetase
MLEESNTLLALQPIRHRYPYDWKTKTPTIIRQHGSVNIYYTCEARVVLARTVHRTMQIIRETSCSCKCFVIFLTVNRRHVYETGA